MELRLPLEVSPGREATCRAVFGTWGFFPEDARARRSEAEEGAGTKEAAVAEKCSESGGKGCEPGDAGGC